MSFQDTMAELYDDDGEIPDSEKTPVTIITGFLGSGKTTLVNYILKEQTDWKICVVENEFGEVAIDNALVEENLAAKEDIITMDNGCVCCSIRGDLVRTFGMLVSRRKEFQSIIIETTGMADPGPVAFTFSSNALIADNFRIDSVVCLVDAKHIDIHLDDVKPDGDINEAEHQVAFADRILLNKTDLVTKDELAAVKDRIKSINGFATIVETVKSRAPLDQVLGLNTFSLAKLEEIDPTLAVRKRSMHTLSTSAFYPHSLPTSFRGCTLRASLCSKICSIRRGYIKTQPRACWLLGSRLRSCRPSVPPPVAYNFDPSHLFHVHHTPYTTNH